MFDLSFRSVSLVCFFVQRADSEWTPLWVQLRSVRSSSTSSVAMSTNTSTRQPPSLWTTPRCSSPTPAWTRYSVSMPLSPSGFVINSSHLTFLCSSLLVQTHLSQHHRPVPPHGQAAACSQHPEVYPCRRQTQRPGRRGQRCLPPHLLRDAGVLVLWRLLQGIMMSCLSFVTLQLHFLDWCWRLIDILIYLPVPALSRLWTKLNTSLDRISCNQDKHYITKFYIWKMNFCACRKKIDSLQTTSHIIFLPVLQICYAYYTPSCISYCTDSFW